MWLIALVYNDFRHWSLSKKGSGVLRLYLYSVV